MNVRPRIPFPLLRGDRAIVTLMLACGVSLTVASLVYLIAPAASLPDFFPGRSDRSHRHLPEFGMACALLGYALFGLAAFAPERLRRAR